MNQNTNKPQAFSEQLADLKASAEKANVTSPEIDRFIREGSEKLQAKILAKQKLTKADFAFMEEAKGMIEAEKIRQANILRQYHERMDTLKYFNFIDKFGKAKNGDAPVPTPEKVLASFTHEELDIAFSLQEPTLLLIPECNFETKVKAIDRNTTSTYWNDTYVDSIFSQSDSGSENIEGWRVVFVDGAKMIKRDDKDDGKLMLGERIKIRKATRRPGERGMDRHTYAMLMMESLIAHKGIDSEADHYYSNTYTLLDDDPSNSPALAPRATFEKGNNRVNFGWRDPLDTVLSAYFRSCVGGTQLI